MNPVSNPRCNVSESAHHWAKNCPHASNDVDMRENINIEKHSEETLHMTLMAEAKLF